MNNYVYIWPNSLSRFVVTNEHEEQIALEAGYQKITQEEYDALVEASKPKQTAVELKIIELNNKINELKSYLASTDYKAIKYIEGELTEEDWLPIKEERHQARIKINELEEQINNL